MATLSTKLQVEGVANFKSAMSQSKAAVKQYSAELKLAEAQYKATGNAEEYLAKKSEILKAQIEEQQKVVEAAEKALEQMTKNGVDPADKAFQQMKTNLTQAQTQLVNMQNDLKGVGDTANTAASETKSLSSELSGIGKNVSLSSIKSGIDSITGAAATAAKTMAALGRGVWDMAVESAQAVDDAATVAAQYGLDGTMGDMSGTEVYMRMKAVEGVTDIGADDLLSAADKMTKGAVNGAVAIADGWQYTLSGNRLQDLFGVVEQINDLYEQGVISDKDSVMEQIFGKSFRNINNLDFESYSQALEEATVINEEQTNSLLEFSNAVDDMTQKFETFKKTISADLAPAMTEIAGAFSGLLQKLIDWANSEEGQAAIENLGEAIAGIITSITEDNFESIIDGAVGVIEDLAEGFRWVILHKDDVVTAFKTIFGVFLGLEAVSGITTVLQLINGLVALGGAQGVSTALSGSLASLGNITLTVGAAYLYAKGMVNLYEYGKGLADEDSPGGVLEQAKEFFSGLPVIGSWLEKKLFEGDGAVFSEKNVEQLTENALNGEVYDPLGITNLPNANTYFNPKDYYYTGLDDYFAKATGRMVEYDDHGHPKKYYQQGEEWYNRLVELYGVEEAYSRLKINPSELIQNGGSGGSGGSPFMYPEDALEEDGEKIVETLTNGIDDSTDMLRMAGYFMAQAIVNGVTDGMSGAGGGGSFSSTYIENMNLNGTGNPGEMFRELQKTRFELNAGYGG